MAVLLGVPASALAASSGTVAVAGFDVDFTAAAGFDNHISVAESTVGPITRETFTETTTPAAQAITAGAGCVVETASRVHCDMSGSPFDVNVTLLDGNDSATPTVAPTFDLTLDGGPGDDVLDASGATPGSIAILGGAGNDTETGGAATFGTVFDEGAAPDGADTLIAGPAGAFGSNVDYSMRTTPITVTTGDGSANDGAAGEADNVGDMPEIDGGSANDTLTSGSGPSSLVGNGGDDRLTAGPARASLRGGAGNDTLTGGPDADFLSGEDGNDSLAGGAGDDALDGGVGADAMSGGSGFDDVSYAGVAIPVSVTLNGSADDGAAEGDNVQPDVEQLDGGSGNDTLTGGASANRLFGNGGDDALDGAGGADFVRGGAGNDTLNARDGFVADDVGCGTGVDTANVDAPDLVGSDCEAINRLPTPPPPPAPKPLPRPTVRIACSSRTLKAKSFFRGVRCRLTPNQPAQLEVSLLAHARRAVVASAFNLTLASTTLKLRAGARTVVLKPSRRVLGRAKRFTVQVRVVAANAANARTIRTKSYRVR